MSSLLTCLVMRNIINYMYKQILYFSCHMTRILVIQLYPKPKNPLIFPFIIIFLSDIVFVFNLSYPLILLKCEKIPFYICLVISIFRRKRKWVSTFLFCLPDMKKIWSSQILSYFSFVIYQLTLAKWPRLNECVAVAIHNCP